MHRKAVDFLKVAGEHMAARGVEYDKRGGERSVARAVAAFNVITGRADTPGRALTESEGWLLLQVLKDVRQWTSPHYHKDSAEDCVAYSALKAESLEREQEENAAWQETRTNP